jgi:dienelactone hydrolase
MRPLELALAGSLMATSAAAATPIGRWLLLLPPVVACAQALLEGGRWQLAPAYGLALAGLGWMARWSQPSLGIAAALALLSWLLATALPWLFPLVHLPLPTGPHAVGTVTYHWVDAGRRTATGPGIDAAPRELMVQLWYPAADVAGAPRARYLEDGRVLAPLAKLLGLPALALRHLGQAITNAVARAPAAGGERPFPVVLFSPGRGGFRQHSSAQMEQLASHGYVVAALDHPGAAAGVVFPDGRVAPFDARMADDAFADAMVGVLAEDACFVLGQLARLDEHDPAGPLAGRLDRERVGIYGVSLGGQVATEACRREPAFRACSALDAWMPTSVQEAGMTRPVLLVIRDAASMRREGWPERAIRRIEDSAGKTFDALRGRGYLVRLTGLFHADFSDAPLFSPLARFLGVAGPLPPARTHALVSAILLGFFDRHLRDLPAAALVDPSAFPEAQLEVR